MDDVYGRIEVFPQHFLPSQQSMDTADGLSTSKSNLDSPPSSRRRSWTPKRVMGAASLLHLLSIPRIRWSSSNEDDDKIELTRAEVESLRTEVADAEERESQLKARLENIDEVLRYARLSGYLYIRSRWTQLPGEPPILDDADVDDWLPRCIPISDLSPQESTMLGDVVEVGHLPNFVPEDGKTRYALYIMTRQGLKFECSSMCEIQVDSWVRALRGDCGLSDDGGEGRNAALATLTNMGRKTIPTAYAYHKSGAAATGSWLPTIAAISAAVYMLQGQEAHAAEMERTFIAIKPDGVQRGLISEILSRFERKGFKLVAVKLVVPSKEFAQKHYHDLKDRPFFNGLCDFLSSGPVLAMVWEGEGVIKYGRKLIGATDPQKSEPGTIRGDLAVVVGRNIIHGSDGPETAKAEIALWFEPRELVSYTSNEEKWVYGVN
uniref:Nucleoside diphosphate kinase n=1 Tax=Leersia perrieri TaxID=77586 RepID=A0A0D9WKL8_9ORYZ